MSTTATVTTRYFLTQNGSETSFPDFNGGSVIEMTLFSIWHQAGKMTHSPAKLNAPTYYVYHVAAPTGKKVASLSYSRAAKAPHLPHSGSATLPDFRFVCIALQCGNYFMVENNVNECMVQFSLVRTLLIISIFQAPISLQICVSLNSD